MTTSLFGDPAMVGVDLTGSDNSTELPMLTPAQQELLDQWIDPTQRTFLSEKDQAQGKRLRDSVAYGRAKFNLEASRYDAADQLVVEALGMPRGLGSTPAVLPEETMGVEPPVINVTGTAQMSLTWDEQQKVDRVIRVAKNQTSDDWPNLFALRNKITEEGAIQSVTAEEVDEVDAILHKYYVRDVGLRRGQTEHEVIDYQRAMLSMAYGEPGKEKQWDNKVAAERTKGGLNPIAPTSPRPAGTKLEPEPRNLTPAATAAISRIAGGEEISDSDRDVISQAVGAMDPATWLTTTYVPTPPALPGRNSRRDLRETQQAGMAGYDAYLETAVMSYLTGLEGNLEGIPGKTTELAQNMLDRVGLDFKAQIQGMIDDPTAAIDPGARRMLRTMLDSDTTSWFDLQGQANLQAMFPQGLTGETAVDPAVMGEIMGRIESGEITPTEGQAELDAITSTSAASVAGLNLPAAALSDEFQQNLSLLWADPWRVQDWFGKMEARSQTPLSAVSVGTTGSPAIWDMNDPAQRAIAINHYMMSDPEGMGQVMAEVNMYTYAGTTPERAAGIQETPQQFLTRMGQTPAGQQPYTGYDPARVGTTAYPNMTPVNYGGSQDAIFNRKYRVDRQEWTKALTRLGSENVGTLNQFIETAGNSDLDWKTLFIYFDYVTGGYKGEGWVDPQTIRATGSQLAQLQAQYGSEFLGLVALQFGTSIADATRDNMLSPDWILTIKDFANALDSSAKGDTPDVTGFNLNSRLQYEVSATAGLTAFAMDKTAIRQETEDYYKRLLFLDPSEAEIEQIYAAVSGAVAERQRAESPYAQTMGKASSGTMQMVDSTGYVLPLPGAQYQSSWGAPRSGGRTHKGIDISAPQGTPIQATKTGTVTSVSATDQGLGGITVFIRDDQGWGHYYAHMMSAPPVKVGDKVFAGQTVGYVGDTGNAPDGAYHLHYGIQKPNGEYTDPYDLLTGATSQYSDAENLPKVAGAAAPGPTDITSEGAALLEALRNTPAYKETFANLPEGMSDEQLAGGIAGLLQSWTGGEVIREAPEAMRAGVKAASSEALWGRLIGDEQAWKESPTLRSRIARMVGVFDSLEQ